MSLVDIEDAHDSLYHQYGAKEIDEFRANLLKWYWENRRKLPWRGDAPPFGNCDKAKPTPAKKTKPEATPTKGNILSFFNKSSTSKAPTATVTTTADAPTGSSTTKTSSSPLSSSSAVSPYGVWVSEIMLQQTRVEAVINYYLAFMSAFPTVGALASAEIDEVNRLWAGLGYYRRAKMLHDGAKSVMNDHDGALPSTVEGLKSIPGIGPYTAGAIGSIAFQIRAPLVDGNVIRVLSRVRAVAADPKNKGLVAFCWELAEALVSPSHPGDFNQALMELGATLCTVTSPRCQECPVRLLCRGRQEVEARQRPFPKPSTPIKTDVCDLCVPGSAKGPSNVCEYPHKAEKKEPTPETYVILVATCRSVKDIKGLCYFLRKRPETGLLAGQWEFPSFLIEDAKLRKRVFDNELKDLFGVVTTTSRRSCGEIVHVFSHRKHTMLIETAELTVPMENENTDKSDASASKKRKMSSLPVGRWVASGEIDSIGLTTGVKKVLARVRSDLTAKKK